MVWKKKKEEEKENKKGCEEPYNEMKEREEMGERHQWQGCQCGVRYLTWFDVHTIRQDLFLCTLAVPGDCYTICLVRRTSQERSSGGR